MQINLDLRQRECLIALAEQEIREWEGIIASLKAGADLVPAKLVKIASAPDSDAAPSEITTRKPRGRRKVKDAKPKTPAKIGRKPKADRAEKPTAAKKIYVPSVQPIVAVLEKAKEPLGLPAIRERLEAHHNVKVTVEALHAFMKKYTGKYFESEGGLWTRADS